MSSLELLKHKESLYSHFISQIKNSSSSTKWIALQNLALSVWYTQMKWHLLRGEELQTEGEQIFIMFWVQSEDLVVLCLKLRKVVSWTTNELFIPLFTHQNTGSRPTSGRSHYSPPGAVTQAWSLGQLRTPAGNRLHFTLNRAWLSNAPRALCSGTRVQTDRLSQALCSWEEFSGGREISEKVRQRALLLRNAFLTPHRWLPERLTTPSGSEGGQAAPLRQHALLTPVLVRLCKAICVLRR